jgi:hypothetical protein
MHFDTFEPTKSLDSIEPKVQSDAAMPALARKGTTKKQSQDKDSLTNHTVWATKHQPHT